MALPFDPDRLLKAGVHALKQRQYSKALSTFEQLQAAEVPKAIQLKAKMGQVRVFRAQGKTAAAVEICRALANSSSRHVQTWAKEQLNALQTTPSQQTDKSGFQPLGSNVKAAAEPASDNSGFQPINPEERTKPQTETSGFQPLETATSTAKASEDVTASREDPPSLFQYDALNSAVGAPSSPLTSTPNNPVAQSLDKTVPPPSPPADATKTETPKPQPAATGPVQQPPTPEQNPPEQNPIDESLLGWQQGTRLKTGRSLGTVKRWRLWFAQVACAILTFGALRYLLHGSFRLVNSYLRMLGRILPLPIRPVRWLSLDYTWHLLAVLLVIGLASPWLWDLWLRWRHQAKSYSTRELGQHSPEAVQRLRKICLTRRWEFPALQRLPTSIPLIFSYGWLPRYGRIVLSQGLLDQLEDDEIAALVAYELSHWRGPDWPLLSLVGLLLQIIYWGYWTLSRWGNRQKRLVTVAAGLLATLCYGIFWLLYKTNGWVARVRTYYRDRTATQLTGNPNGLIRALGKLSFGLSEAIAAQGYTPPLIDTLSLQLPTGAASTLAMQAEHQHQPLTTLFQWDALNPWRSWLSLNQPQPPLGDRLQLLTAYARHWRLTPTLDFSVIALANRRAKGLTPEEWRRLLFQAGPWSGLTLGATVGVGLWCLGAIATQSDIAFLDWLNQDFTIVKSAALLGLGVGILLRLNAFFPDMPPQLSHTAAEFPDWLTAPNLLPSDSLPVQISGQLVGQPGIANWLGQDLLLKTKQGVVKLHYFSALGPIGNCLPWGARPHQKLNQTVTVTGWFRRGQQVWIDVLQLRGADWQINGNHPVWSLVAVAIATVMGLWILIRG